MKNTYIAPELEVLELGPKDGLLQLSGGTGTGSDMLDPDTGQNPFGIFEF